MRIEWVKARLDNWALWSERQRAGGLGFATRSVLAHCDRVDEMRQTRLPVDEVDAAVTDQAVSSLKPEHPELHRTLVLIYIDGIGIKATARVLQRDPSTVSQRLSTADRHLAGWFTARAEKHNSSKKSFTP